MYDKNIKELFLSLLENEKEKFLLELILKDIKEEALLKEIIDLEDKDVKTKV